MVVLGPTRMAIQQAKMHLMDVQNGAVYSLEEMEVLNEIFVLLDQAWAKTVRLQKGVV